MARTQRHGVLFDVDGTLVDTTYPHVLAWWEALSQFGHRVPMARIHRAIGMGSDQLLDHLLGHERDRSDDEAMAGAHSAHYFSFRQRAVPLEGAPDLLEACAAHGLVVVLASSASADELAVLRRVLDVEHAIAAATSAQDAEATKPAPDIVAAALEASGLEASSALYVGDAVWDVASAGQLGVGCIGLTSGGLAASELLEAGALETWEGPRHLLEHLEASALARLW